MERDRVLVVIGPCGLAAWRTKNDHRIKSIQVGTQVGEFNDGTRFKYIVAEGDWLQRLRGIRWAGYMEFGINLKSHERASLQAMCNRG